VEQKGDKMDWFDEQYDPVRISTNSEFKHAEGQIIISFNHLPKNCYECPVHMSSYDEDGFFGDNMIYYCPFGGSNRGSAIKRPEGCPIKKVSKNKKFSKIKEEKEMEEVVERDIAYGEYLND